MARRLESALGVVVEFVVLVFSIMRHVDINLARHSRTGVVSLARTSARRSAKEGASDAPYSIQYTAVPWFGTWNMVMEGWTTTKNVFGRVGRLQTETSPGGLFPWTPYLIPEPNVSGSHVIVV